MIILRPYETRLLMPVAAREWRAPSQSVPLDQMGNPTKQTRFRLRARAHDGGILWQGWFDDREDCDAFLEAIAFGTLKYQRPLWDLPSPGWHPWLDSGLFYEFATVTFLTTTGSNQTYSKPADWNNSDNSVECIGGGGGGASGNSSGGAGAGAYIKVSNITLSGDATYRVGSGGSGGTGTGTPSNGQAGGQTWFNDTVFPTTGTNKVGADNGRGGVGQSFSTAAGGAIANCYPTTGSTRYAGGNGATDGGTNYTGSGGGGAGGPSGAGANGSAAGSTTGGAGGTGGNGSGGAGGAGGTSGSTSGKVGGNGTEFDASNGSGGGGGGGYGSSGATGYVGGAGGNYGGGGGGGGYGSSTKGAGGAGIQGLIVVIYTPAVSSIFGPKLKVYIRR